MKFKDQVVLITGVGRGIGKAMALAFAREGADIGFAEIDPELARAAAAEIKAEGRRVFFALWSGESRNHRADARDGSGAGGLWDHR